MIDHTTQDNNGTLRLDRLIELSEAYPFDKEMKKEYDLLKQQIEHDLKLANELKTEWDNIESVLNTAMSFYQIHGESFSKEQVVKMDRWGGFLTKYGVIE